MEKQAISIVAIKNAFADYKTKKDTADDAQLNLDGLGTKPALPQFVDADSDYSDAITARNTWEANKASYTNALNSNTTQAATLEQNVIALLPPNTWVRVDLNTDDTGTPGETTDYYWIGYNTNTTPGYHQFIRQMHQDAQPATPLTENMDA